MPTAADTPARRSLPRTAVCLAVLAAAVGCVTGTRQAAVPPEPRSMGEPPCPPQFQAGTGGVVVSRSLTVADGREGNRTPLPLPPQVEATSTSRGEAGNTDALFTSSLEGEVGAGAQRPDGWGVGRRSVNSPPPVIQRGSAPDAPAVPVEHLRIVKAELPNSTPALFTPTNVSPLPAVTNPTVEPVAQLPPVVPVKAEPPSSPLPLPHVEPVPDAAVGEPGPIRIGGRLLSPGRALGVIDGGEVLPALPSAGGCASCGGESGSCTACEPFPRTGLASRIVGGFYDALCCPDPCYQPKWMPLADTAFFTESARPVSQTRVREEYMHAGQFPDRAEFFWARADGNGKGPKPVGVAGVPRVDTHDISLYAETASGGKFSAFVITPYRSVNPAFADPDSAAGFGDITIGTKSVLFDSELAVTTLQFKTVLPVGNPRKGLGTGHVSLEPSLLFGLRTSRDSYLQAQVAEWIPIGGDPTYSGALLHYHAAFNHVLWKPIEAVQLIGTMELHGYSFQDGGFTDPDGGFRKASGTTILQAGPGLRLFFCDSYDIGAGSSFGISGKNNVRDTYRFELRVRY